LTHSRHLRITARLIHTAWMPRLAAALVTLAVSACLPAHAPATRKIGMITSITGVLGMMATAVVQRYADSDEALTVFTTMSAGGILVFAVGELSMPPKGPRPETETEKHRRWARILTERASGAAREGRCPRVRRLEKRVNVYDREVHDFVFMRDARIVECLTGTPPIADPADDATGTPPLPLSLSDTRPADGPPDPAPDGPTLTLPPGTVLPPAP
jgi:hypothetical protein